MNPKRNAPQIFLAVSLVVLAMAVGCKKNDDKNFVQVDRMAVPAINTALIDTPDKDAYNLGDPSTDVPTWRAKIVTKIIGLRAAVAGVLPAENFGTTPDALADIVCPDVVTIDFASPLVFPNGRGLDDDVMDLVVGLVLNRDLVGGGVGISDAIDMNDATTLGTFPYLAAPN
jgi:hypothetical protein